MMLDYGPRFSGKHLGIRPGETAAERSLELSARLSMVEDQRNALAEQIKRLEEELKLRDQKLAEAVQEIMTTRQDLSDANEQMSQWRMKVEQLNEEVEKARKSNIETLQTIITLIRDLLGDDGQFAPNAGS